MQVAFSAKVRSPLGSEGSAIGGDFRLSAVKMDGLRSSPLVGVSAAVFLGVAVATYSPVAPPVGLGVLGAVLSLSLPRSIRKECFAGLFALVAGAVDFPRSSARAPHSDAVVVLSGKVVSHPKLLGNRWVIELHPDTLRRHGEFLPPPRIVRLELPDGSKPPVIGSWVRARGKLRRLPEFENRSRTPAGTWALSIKAERFLESEMPRGPWRVSATIRSRIQTIWRGFRSHSEPAAALGEMFLLGDRWAAPQEWQEGLRRTGLFHLVAASGFNVALVAGGAYAVTSLFLKRSFRVGFALCAILGYLALVGPEPSLLRASLMGAGILISFWLGRPSTALHMLTVTSAALLLIQPSTLQDLGWRLSVAATAGILLLTKAVASRFELWVRSRPLAFSLAVSVSAQLATLPDTLHAFGYLHPLGPITNLCFGFFATVALILALCITLASLGGLEQFSALGLRGLRWVAYAFGWLNDLPPSPWVAWRPQGSLVELGFPAGVLAGFCTKRKIVQKLLFGFALFISVCHPPTTREEVELVMADVGQGESLLLRSGSRAILVDGGGITGRNLAAEVLVPLLAEKRISSLALAILTHPDRDHCQGLLELTRWIPIARVWLPPSRYDSRCSRLLTKEMAGRVLRVRAGLRAELGPIGLRVLAPFAPQQQRGNLASVVIQVEAGGRKVLFAGDLETRGELSLVAREGKALQSDILKVAHHGSRTSTSAAWLKIVRPRIALISAGPQNSFGHPHLEVLERLASARCRVLRTDLSGVIELRWRRGGPISVELPRSPRRMMGRLP